MATLSVQAPAASGTAITFVAAAAGGDKFANSGSERLIVKNASGGSITVTIDSPGTCNFGASADSAHDLIVTVADGAESWIGPLSQAQYNDTNGFANISYSAATSVTVAVTRR